MDSPLQDTPGRKLFWLKLGRSRWHSPAVSNFALVGTTAVLGLLTVRVQGGGGVGREQTSPRWCLTASQAPGCLLQAGSSKQAAEDMELPEVPAGMCQLGVRFAALPSSAAAALPQPPLRGGTALQAGC